MGSALRLEAIIDSGATYSCVNSELYDKLLEEGAIKGELPVQNVKLVVAVGKRRIEVRKQVVVEITWSTKRYIVLTFVVKDLFTSLVLGLNWLRENRVLIDCEKNQIQLKGEMVDRIKRKNNKSEEGDVVPIDRETKLGILTIQKGSYEELVREVGKNQQLDESWERIIQDIKERRISVKTKKNYCIYGDILFLEKKTSRNKWVVCVPRKDVQPVLNIFHEKHLHPGINRMQKMMGNLMVWKGMMKDISAHVRSLSPLSSGQM